MRKSFLYGLVLATALFSGCKGDYDDWAAPQTNPQEEAQSISVSISAASAIDMENVTSETVQLYSGASVSAPEGFTVTGYEAIISKSDNSSVKTVMPANASGSFATSDVVSIVESFYGKNPVARTLSVTVNAYVQQDDQAFCVTSNSVDATVTLITPDISESYYLVGDMCGWDAEHMIKFDHSDTNIYDDPVFTLTFETTAENQYWKIIPQKNIDEDNFWANPGVVGVAVDGDTSMSGYLVNDGANAGKIEEVAKYVITINMIEYTYTIEKAATELYMTGSEYGWGDTANGGMWKQLAPVWGTDNDYWLISYFTSGEMFKFAPQAGWGNDFGGEATLNDEAGSGVRADGTNLVIDNAGWYLIHVVNGAERVVNVCAPDVYLIGNTASAGWNVDAACKFTVPEGKDGEFVSPAFAASDEVRMCVSFGGYDWWKTEFIVLDGQIVYRGKGDEQQRVSVTEGQNAYLNFTDGTGSFK